jgi:hypothetical protein
MTDPLTLLRDADPAARMADVEPPRDVLERIVATPPPRRRRPRRRLAVAIVAAAVAAAALLGVLVPGERTNLAARAYAATAPDEGVLYTELTDELIIPGEPVERSVTRIWQRGDRSRRARTVLDGPGRPGAVTEHVLDDGVLRTRLPDGEIQVLRPDFNEEAPQVLEGERTSFVDSFRSHFAAAELRDAGLTTFVGRPAHAYEARGRGDVQRTYYLDPESAMPLGYVLVFPMYEPVVRNGRLGPGAPTGEGRITQVLRRFERLPATPENLARLTAPWVKPLSRAERRARPGS